MFKIGEFARIGQVTVEALRHYDALGLLKPARVDRFTGYRYYAAGQLGALNRILALKELGFSLEAVGRLLRDDLPPAVFRDLLAARLEAAEREVDEAQARLTRIRAHLTMLELEETMSLDEITLKAIEPLLIVSTREIVPSIEEMPDRCAAMFDAVAGWMWANRLPLGPSLSIYYGDGAEGGGIDTECAFVVSGNPSEAPVSEGAGRITVRRLEAVPLAATLVITDGFYRKAGGLLPAYQALGRWVEANGYVMDGLPREVFYGSVAADDLTAEVQFPVRRANATS